LSFHDAGIADTIAVIKGRRHEKVGKMQKIQKNIQWISQAEPVSYPDALAFMENRVAAIRTGEEPETVWLLEHPALYTGGTSASPADLLTPDRFPVYDSGRGGQYTYHGPGQRVGYGMLDLSLRGKDVRAFVRGLESWLIAALGVFGVESGRRQGRIGIWVTRDDGREEKIAALGLRIRHWISFHGISLNVNPDLTHFGGIVPCGISEHGVTSLWDLGVKVSMNDVDEALRRTFNEIF
jgi:lipoyl(octanoyl) transferase